MTVLGSFQGHIRYKELKITETVYIIKGQKSPFLSKKACVNLRLVACIHSVTDQSTPNIKQQFPKLFTGLGLLQNSYTITMNPHAQPMCIYGLRIIPHPAIPKVNAEMDRMLTEGVISPVKEPTNWCSGIVVVPKHTRSVRICVDVTNVNKAVKGEVHPTSLVNECLAKIAHSKVFSKLDGRNGYWQIPLDHDSRLYITFVTPMGSFCLNRLPFGMCSASEVCQRTMNEILVDLQGVICHMDDILVHSTNRTNRHMTNSSEQYSNGFRNRDSR